MSKTTEPTTPAAPAGTPPAAAGTPPATTPPAAGAPPAAPATFLGEPPKATEKPAEGEKPPEKPAETKPADKPALEVKFAEEMGVSEEQQKAFTELAQSLELDSAKAQKLVDHYASLAKASREATDAAFIEQQKQGRAAIEADKELGGANAAATRALAHKAIAKFGSAELSELLDNGLGNHLGMVRFLAAVGKGIAEDSVTTTKTTNGSGGEITEEQLLKNLYPSMHKES